MIFISFFLRILDSQFLFVIGTVLMASFLLSPLNLTKTKMVKIVQKFLFNLGAAFLFWWIWTAPYLFINNLISFFLIFGPLFMIVNAYHGYSVYKKCKKCEYAINWDICPGFVNIKNYIKNNELPDIFKSQAK